MLTIMLLKENIYTGDIEAKVLGTFTDSFEGLNENREAMMSYFSHLIKDEIPTSWNWWVEIQQGSEVIAKTLKRRGTFQPKV